MNDDFDDKARYLSRAIEMLEGDGEHNELMSEEEVFGADDLDVADQISGQVIGGISSLEGKVSLRDQRWNDLYRVAPFARINPPSVLKGTLGGQQEVSVGQNRPVAMWGGDDAETVPVTVTFAPVDPFPFPPVPQVGLSTIRPFGIVRWGTRGFSATATIDIGRGVQFTINASEVELQVGVESFTGAQTSVKLGGMLSFYPTTHTPSITRSIYCEAFDSGAGFVVAVPNFARGVLLNPIPVANTTARWDLLFESSVGTGVGGYSYPATAAGVPVLNQNFIPLSGQVAFVQVDSPGGSGNTLPFDLIFELAL